jgi:hypothetical protein
MNYDQQPSTFSTTVTDSMDQMMRLPIKVTEGTVDAMMDGMRWMANGFRRDGTTHSGTTYTDASSGTTTTRKSGASSSGSSLQSTLRGALSDQDLRGDDLKYVVWSIVFTKPGFETVLEPQHEEIVNYEADSNTYAAMKIAKFVESARSGRVEKPNGWNDRSYPAESAANGVRRPEAASFAGNKQENNQEKGWRIPPEDQRYITFLYRVERRLPRQEVDVTRVERVTVERTKTAQTAIA